jgi:V/A-type H+-transporting ATPase subunit I
MWRPVPARWFEVLVAHDDAPAALAALAQSGAVELEARPLPARIATTADLREPLGRYRALADQYRRYWPAPRMLAEAEARAPRDLLLRALGRLSVWKATAEPVVRVLQAREQELAELEVWQEVLARFRDSRLDFGLLAEAAPLFVRRLYLFTQPPEMAMPQPAIGLWFETGHGRALLVAAPRAAMEALHREATARKGRPIELPPWLEGRASESLGLLVRRRRRAAHGVQRLRAVLERINDSTGVANALADIERLRWYAEHVQELAASEHFAWLTGWSALGEGELRAALAAAKVRALLRLPEPPAGVEPPLVLRNPWWARPFELFARALGMPARSGVDPSALLAVVTPLLFGYMFADVGQGLVLLLAGLFLGRRVAALRLLVPGGASAMVFGGLFGSVFAREDLMGALWLHPLAEPLTVLALPLAFGALLLTLGLALNGLQAHWRGEAAHWWQRDAGLVVFYVGALLAIGTEAGWTTALLGLGWYLGGAAYVARTAGEWLRALGSLIERGFQLAVNTLSFARVGAFALAHAGLSSAIVALAAASGDPAAAAAVMVAGNLIVIVLEGLVVSIQTTRLVLFEFFVRFFTAQGRALRPLPAPPSHLLRRYA